MKENCTTRMKQLFVILLLISSHAVINAQTIISNANVALNKAATSSSVQDYHNAKDAFDGNLATRASTFYNDDEWIGVDLGQVYLVSQIVLVWERAYGKDYNILFSRDGSFTDLNIDSVQIRNNVLGSDSVAGTNTIAMKANTIARYVRMQGVHRATEFGYSIYEFKVAASISSSSVLPVTLTGFTATQINNTNVLEWTTTTENDAAGFSIERSNDGTNFNSIGWVNSTNGGTVVSHYTFIDKQPSLNKNYYRIKVSDLNGKTGSTGAISINSVNNGHIRIYPVPAKDHLSVEYNASIGEEVTITLLNSTGQPVNSIKVTASGSQQAIIMNRTSNMLPGIYFISVISADANTKFSQQIVLQ